MAGMTVRIVYFARVREAMGCDAETCDLPANLVTLGDVADWFAAQGHAIFADRDRLRAAIDQTMAGFDTPIAGAREIAFFPPVTGG